MDDYPEANARHYAFMLEGLRDVDGGAGEARDAVRRAARVACECGAAACRKTPRWSSATAATLRHQRRWRDAVADGCGVPVVQVESDVVVPSKSRRDKQEFAARTIRPKIHRRLERVPEAGAAGEAMRRFAGAAGEGGRRRLPIR